jgi:hypothetical protein
MFLEIGRIFMSQLKKILGINILILLGYTLLIHANASKGGEGLDVVLESMLAVGLQVAINFIVSMIHFSTKNDSLGKAFLLSTAVVLVIGFSTCWGSAFL